MVVMFKGDKVEEAPAAMDGVRWVPCAHISIYTVPR
jgi:hypothetical protein